MTFHPVHAGRWELGNSVGLWYAFLSSQCLGHFGGLLCPLTPRAALLKGRKMYIPGKFLGIYILQPLPQLQLTLHWCLLGYENPSILTSGHNLTPQRPPAATSWSYPAQDTPEVTYLHLHAFFTSPSCFRNSFTFLINHLHRNPHVRSTLGAVATNTPPLECHLHPTCEADLLYQWHQQSLWRGIWRNKGPIISSGCLWNPPIWESFPWNVSLSPLKMELLLGDQLYYGH